jgi:hypothetical protein
MSKLNAELALALALDGKLTRLDDETATLVAVVDALRALPEPEIDASFAMALEHRLLTDGLEAETPMPVGRPQLRVVPAFPATPADDVIRLADNVVTMPTRRFKVRKSVAAMAACFMLGAFPVMAASSALPGSPFYGIKQRLHSAQLALFGGAAQDATWRLGFAAEHVREAEALVALGADDSLVSGALDLAAYELAKAGETIAGITDPEQLARFAEEAAATESLLRKSAPTLVPGSSDAFDRAMAAATTLTDSINGSLGVVDGASIGALIESAAADAHELIEDVPNEPPSSVDGEASGKAKVTAGEESASDDPTPGPDDDGDGDTKGKALRNATDTGCGLPGSYQLDQVTDLLSIGGIDAEFCASAAADV